MFSLQLSLSNLPSFEIPSLSNVDNVAIMTFLLELKKQENGNGCKI